MNRRPRGFSLVEVVVAVGVFVAGVVAAVALLAQTTRSASERLERGAAERVNGSVAALLDTVNWEVIMARLEGGESWYADRTGARIDLVDPVAAEDRFFEVVMERDGERFTDGAEGSAAQAELWIRTSWPVQSGSGAVVAVENRETLRTRVVLLR